MKENTDYEILMELRNDGEADFWDEDKTFFTDAIVNAGINFPCKLEAAASNWRGATGYATADDGEELISSCFSFANDELSLRRNDQGVYIRTGSHDVPMGFNIYIENLTEKELAEESEDG